MLLEFKVRNFRSIREELTLSMLASGRVGKNDLPDNIFQSGKHKAVKSLIMYGRNASGKSNIISAIQALQYLVTKSDMHRVPDKIAFFEPFLLDDEFSKEPTTMEIEFIDNGNNRFLYSVEYNLNEIIYEKLYFFPNGVRSKLFERKGLSLTYGEFFTGNRKSIENGLLNNQLFLSKSSYDRNQHLNEAFSYLGNEIFVIQYRSFETDLDWLQDFNSGFSTDPEFRKFVQKILKMADTNITNLKSNVYSQVSPNFTGSYKSSINDNLKQYLNNEIIELKTIHKKYNNGKVTGTIDFYLNQESMGTRKLLFLAPEIYRTLYMGGLLVIDELDKSLHPLLTKMLISLFNNPEANPNNGQLIFATHDSSLLDTDIFRRDQIAFVEKENQGNTELYRLSDFRGVRKDIPLDKWYLSGRFGAIPVIGDYSLNYD